MIEPDLERRKERAIMIGVAGFVIALAGLYGLSDWLAQAIVMVAEVQ